MNAIAETLNTAEIVSEQRHDALTVQYLTVKPSCAVDILSFREAMDGGALQITEVGEEGNVPELCFRLAGTNPASAFIPEGSIIEGLKQSRYVVASFVINQNESLIVPVNCVEQDRWVYQGNYGQRTDFYLYPSLRAVNSREVTLSLRAGNGYKSRKTQSETWKSIEHRLQSTKSDSSYVGDYYRDSKKSVSAYLRGMIVPDEVSGLIAFINGKLVELTIMGNPRLFESHAQGLLNAIAVDCLDEQYRKSLRNKKEMTYRQFMDAIIKAEVEPYPAVGVGQDLRFENKELVGSALVDDKGNLICLGAYTI